MKCNKIFGAVIVASALLLASCGENLDNPANLASAAAAVNGGQTSYYISNFRYAVGTDPSVVEEGNIDNWNPKTVEFLEKIFIAFDVNTSRQIKSLKYIETLNNKTVLESQITANLNGSYKDGIGRIGNSLCLNTIIDAGIGEFKYRIEATFDDGSISAITSNPIQVGKLSMQNRISNLRVAPMIDTNEAWGILNTTGAEVVEGEHGRIAFTMRNWSDTANIKNIYHVISLKDNSGEYRRWWWTTTGIGNFGEKAWSKAANNSLYTPVLKPEGEVKYEVFVNFKDGTTERIEKEIISVKKFSSTTNLLSNLRWSSGKWAPSEIDEDNAALKAKWNPNPISLSSSPDADKIMLAFDVNTNMKIKNIRYIEQLNNKIVDDEILTWADPNAPFNVDYGRVGKAYAMSIMQVLKGDMRFYLELTFEDGTVERIASPLIKFTK